MRVAIFAEGSQTTTNLSENETAIDYFQGTFQPVATLEEEISKYANTELHILSEQHGYLRGDMSSEEISGSDVVEPEAEEKFTGAIVTAARNADIIVILLSSSTFRHTVTKGWDEILSNTVEDSIWCFGASKSVLQSIELGELRDKVDTVLVYERVGVAPIGEEIRNQLIQQVRARYAQDE